MEVDAGKEGRLSGVSLNTEVRGYATHRTANSDCSDMKLK